MATAMIEQPTVGREPTLGDSLMKVRRRITVEEYHRIVDSGAFEPEPKVELLEGVIVRRMVSCPSHNVSCDLIPCVLRDQGPTGDGEAAVYARTQILGSDDEVPLILDGREVGRFPVKEILP